MVVVRGRGPLVAGGLTPPIAGEKPDKWSCPVALEEPQGRKKPDNTGQSGQRTADSEKPLVLQTPPGGPDRPDNYRTTPDKTAADGPDNRTAPYIRGSRFVRLSGGALRSGPVAGEKGEHRYPPGGYRGRGRHPFPVFLHNLGPHFGLLFGRGLG